MRKIPDDILLAADAALLQANVKAHMLGEPTDPLECIGMAILAERDEAYTRWRGPLITLMNHLEDVLSDDDWNKVDIGIWNAVTVPVLADE